MADAEGDDTQAHDREREADAADLEYFKWSSERLMSLVEREDQRWGSLENKAVVAVTVALGFAAFSFQDPMKLKDIDRLSVTLGIAALLAVLASMYFGYRTLRTGNAKDPNPDQFVDPAVLERDPSERCQVVAKHLVNTIKLSRDIGNRKGNRAGWAQQLAFIGALLFVLFQISRVK